MSYRKRKARAKLAVDSRNHSATKKGPGRKAVKSIDGSSWKIPRTMVAPEPEKKLRANVGTPDFFEGERRVWREGEPVHIVKPVRAARIEAAKEAA